MNRRNRDADLHGFVFTDEAHARAWLAQPFVDRANITLETVEVWPSKPCPRCRGAGFHQEIRATGKMTVDAFLGKTP